MLGLLLWQGCEDSPCALRQPLLQLCQGPGLLHTLSNACTWLSLVADDYEVVAKP